MIPLSPKINGPAVDASGGLDRLDRVEHIEKKMKPHPQVPQVERSPEESELAKLVSGPKPSRAKTLWGYFDRILRFFGITGLNVNMDLLNAIHSDVSLSSYYTLISTLGD